MNYSRISGKNRIETGVQVSKKYFSKAETVIVVDGNKFPDALSASVLAKALEAPILLTSSSSLEALVKAEIERLGAKKMLIVGGEAVVSKAVERELEKLGQVERISGTDRFETSSKVARKTVEITGNSEEAIIANGLNFADALAVAPFAAREGLPILLVSKNALPEPVEKVLKDLEISKVTITGGEAAVSKSLEKDLPKVSERLSGKNRFETAIAIAKAKFNTVDQAFLASGISWADALVIGPVAGKENQLILLTSKEILQDSVKNYVLGSSIREITAIGGTGVLTDSTLKGFIEVPEKPEEKPEEKPTEEVTLKDGVYWGSLRASSDGNHGADGVAQITKVTSDGKVLTIEGSLDYNTTRDAFFSSDKNEKFKKGSYSFKIDKNTKFQYIVMDLRTTTFKEFMKDLEILKDGGIGLSLEVKNGTLVSVTTSP